MEEKNIIKLDPEKLNSDSIELPAGIDISLEKVAELPRDEKNKLIIDTICIGVSKRNNRIVPNEVFDKYYRELPDKVENASGTWRTVSTGGKIKILGGDPEGDRKIQQMGAETLNASKAQRRTFAEVIEEMLTKPASNQMIEDLELRAGATNLDAVIASAFKQSAKGNVKAMDFLRDTIGQKPTDKIDASVTALTAEDKQMLENISARLGSNLE